MKINQQERRSVYDMTTSQGLTVSIMTLGAGIEKIILKNQKEQEHHLALGFPDISNYKSSDSYAGATLGPNAGRISGTNPPCQLHGGINNLSFYNWQIESLSYDYASARICLSAYQPDGMDGYPGNRLYHVTYTLEDTNWLSIDYRATTDADTYINMSNHTYWNLSGDFSLSALKQKLQIFSNNVCINTEHHLPFDIIPVAGTAFDFRELQPIDALIRTAADPVSRNQLQIGNGYNNAFLLNKQDKFRKLRSVKHEVSLKNACILKDVKSGCTLKMLTDAPALVLYSGGYLPEGISLHGGALSSRSCAIALEAQDIPDVMHLLPSSCCLTTPMRPFHRTIRFHISA